MVKKGADDARIAWARWRTEPPWWTHGLVIAPGAYHWYYPPRHPEYRTLRTVECDGVEIPLGTDYGVPPGRELPGVVNRRAEWAALDGQLDWHAADPLWNVLRPRWPSDRTLRRFLDDFDAFLQATAWPARWDAAVRVAQTRRVFSLRRFNPRVLAEIRRRTALEPNWKRRLRTELFPEALCEALRRAWHPQRCVKLGAAIAYPRPHWVARVAIRSYERADFAPIRLPRVPQFRWLRAATNRYVADYILGDRLLPRGTPAVPDEDAYCELYEAIEAKEILEQLDLTPRERSVIERWVDGFPDDAIAAELGCARGTVRRHREEALRKNRR
jgi:hypothetical protein